MQGFRSYVNGLRESKLQGLPAPKDERFTALLAIQRGWLDTILRVSQNGAERVRQADLQVATQIASDLQDFLTAHVTDAGFALDKDKTDEDIEFLSISNDLLLLVLTEAHYYANNPVGLKASVENYKTCLGVNSTNPLSTQIKRTPAFLYSAAKYAHLLGKHSSCLSFVNSITELDNISGYFAHFFRQLHSVEGADLRPDRGGLAGFAPVIVQEERLIKELVRIGFVAFRECARTADDDVTLKKMGEILQRMEGKLTPSQALSFYLVLAQDTRDKADYERASYYIECAWRVIGDQNGYLARRIEHNEAEIEVHRSETPSEEMPDPKEAHDRAWKILVIERNLHLEERSATEGTKSPMRVWEYDASYFQALIRFACLKVPDAPLQDVDRRKKTSFSFPEFEDKSMAQWIEESFDHAKNSLAELNEKSPENAKRAGEAILAWLRSQLPMIQDAEIQKLPILSEWEALVLKLK